MDRFDFKVASRQRDCSNRLYIWYIYKIPFFLLTYEIYNLILSQFREIDFLNGDRIEMENENLLSTKRLNSKKKELTTPASLQMNKRERKMERKLHLSIQPKIVKRAPSARYKRI